MDEREYRQKVHEVFDAVEKAFEDVDPDLMDCESQAGALTLVSASGARFILSTQPSLRQIWLAVASLGRAYHFKWDEQRTAWVDEKDPSLELKAYLRQYAKSQAGVDLALK